MVATVKELEERLYKLEAVDEIKRLKSRYAQIVDKFSKEPFENCFTEDGVWDLGPTGSVKGRKAIGEFFKKVPEFMPFSFHYFLSGDIIVDGDKATGQWYMLQTAIVKGGRGLWLAAVEYEKYQRVKKQWLISELKLTSVFRTPYAEGWHKTRFVDV